MLERLVKVNCSAKPLLVNGIWRALSDETSANEMSVLADKLNAGRNAIEEQIAEALTRIENSKKLAKSSDGADLRRQG